MDKDGLDVIALEKSLEAGVVPVMMYVVTTAHNPTGRTLTAERREDGLTAGRGEERAGKGDRIGEQDIAGEDLPHISRARPG